MIQSSTDLAALRRDYRAASLDESGADPDPFRQFARWFDEACAAELPEANAMAVASVDQEGRPSVRILLLKGVEGGGFVFYTNYMSRKAREFAANPNAAATFLWYPIERQVRIEGHVERVSAEDSDAYFKVRPLGSRIGAWASPQSEVIESRQVLERREAQMRATHGEDPPRPPHWGGYRLLPRSIEFWQGRSSRLHDRLLYRVDGNGGWLMQRLAP